MSATLYRLRYLARPRFAALAKDDSLAARDESVAVRGLGGVRFGRRNFGGRRDVLTGVPTAMRKTRPPEQAVEPAWRERRQVERDRDDVRTSSIEPSLRGAPAGSVRHEAEEPQGRKDPPGDRIPSPREATSEAPGESALAADLCRRVASGDDQAFATLVETYQHRIYNFCARMLGDTSEAEDLAQDVFLALYKNASEFREESSFTTWLYRIARNQTLNRIKYLERRGRTARRSLEEVGEDRLGSSGGDPYDLLEEREASLLLQEAIAELPEQQRLVLVLRDIEGRAYEEIGEITGLAIGTVKSRIHRARSALAERLSRVL